MCCSPGLGAAVLLDGCAHRAGVLPRVPHQQLPADDEADRLLSRQARRRHPGLPDVKERVDLFFAQPALFRDQIQRVARLHRKLVVLDLRDEPVIHAGNRFVVSAMFPQCGISMPVMWGREKVNTVYSVGKSIFERASPVAVGELMLAHGGGGHPAADTCQGAQASAQALKQALIERISRLSGWATVVAAAA